MPRPVRQNAGSPGKNAVTCPICGRHCSPSTINAHLDKCLSSKDDSSPPRKRSKQDSYAESENDVETEPVHQPGQLNAEWAAILKNQTKEEKKTPKSEKKKKEKKKSKKDSTQSSSGDGLSTPKKTKSEKGAKSEKSSAKKEKREKSVKGEKKKKRKRKHKDKGDDDDVFDFDADEMEGAKKKVSSTDGTPNKATTPSKKTTLNDKNATPTHKKSPASHQSPKKSSIKSPFVSLSPKQASQSFWARQNAQSMSPNYQAMKFSAQTPPGIGKATIQTPPTAKTNAQSPTPQSTKPTFGATPSQPRPDFRPLAERMRPYTMDTLIGQNKALGATGTLRRLLDVGNIPSMIFWGPPGCGKTSLANVIARQAKVRNTHRFITFSATTSNVSDVKSAVEIARNEQRMYRRKTILFIDEIHRFNKTQQDTFLLHVENGTIILIGATTENPSFRVNSALLSRCRVVVLEKLSPESIMLILERALKEGQVGIVEDPLVADALPNSDKESTTISIEREALCLLANLCDGDARSALNSLQMVLDVAKGSTGGQQADASKVLRSSVITIDQIRDSLQRSHISYDKSGEEHYNCASALQKSIRASDANAAVYWLGRMLVGGEDPLYIARRLVVCASEDVGAVGLCISNSAVASPPNRDALNLAHCAIYLSRAPKSRQVATVYARVKDCLKNHQGPTPPIPLHLQTPATKYQLVRNTLGGWGKGRVMAGGYEGHMPESLAGLDFFSMST
eukprot:XP_011672972.1 PREDICTED: ATPase WRNIP1-like [Strongylocentrotus purpuratus]